MKANKKEQRMKWEPENFGTEGKETNKKSEIELKRNSRSLAQIKLINRKILY